MAETNYTTNMIEKILSYVSPLVAVKFLDNTDTYPYSVTSGDPTALSVLNTSATNELTVILTFDDASTLTIPIPVDKIYNGEFDKIITTVNISGTTPEFTLELLKRGV